MITITDKSGRQLAFEVRRVRGWGTHQSVEEVVLNLLRKLPIEEYLSVPQRVWRAGTSPHEDPEA